MSVAMERTDNGALERLRALLRDEGGLMATLVEPTAAVEADACVEANVRGATNVRIEVDAGADQQPAASPASIAASGPRAAGRRKEYELLVEAIYEGYLLHYGAPRVVQVPEEDLKLLAGDRLYAIGLARLVALGDTAAVAELADTITLSALAQGAGSVELAQLVWMAGARAVGWGTSPAHSRAKTLVLAGAPEAIEAMRTSTIGLLASP
jgi:hypothetical protein